MEKVPRLGYVESPRVLAFSVLSSVLSSGLTNIRAVEGYRGKVFFFLGATHRFFVIIVCTVHPFSLRNYLLCVFFPPLPDWIKFLRFFEGKNVVFFKIENTQEKCGASIVRLRKRGRLLFRSVTQSPSSSVGKRRCPSRNALPPSCGGETGER